MTFKISDIELGIESPEFVKEVIGKDAKLLKITCFHQCKDGTTMIVDMAHKDFDEENDLNRENHEEENENGN